MENDNFLFDEQAIQDERLLNLETRVLDVENSTEGNQMELTTFCLNVFIEFTEFS